MRRDHWWKSAGVAAAISLSLSAAACNDSDDDDGMGGDMTTLPEGGDAQTPPQTATAVETWLAEGTYKTWACESAIHEAREPSPHGFNRICSNNLVAANATGTDPWPAGAAAVKELYASATDTTPVGYAVYLKLASDSEGGDNWYWYERVPLDHPAPHDADGVVADGNGESGPAKTICVGCHVAAGADPAHTPSAGGRDQVYTPVL